MINAHEFWHDTTDKKEIRYKKNYKKLLVGMF